MPFDFSTLQSASIWGYVLVFAGGIVTSLGPCNVATVPLIVGFVGGSQTMSRSRSFVLSLTFAIGLAITFMSLGIVAAIVGGVLGMAAQWWYYLVAVVCIAIGLHMLGALPLQMPDWLGDLRQGIGLKGIPGALALGLISGLVASQCATPVLAAILTYVMAEAALVYGASLLFVYALGRGLPVVMAGTFAGALKGMLTLGRWSTVMERGAGVLIIGVGFYFLWLA
jgi:cytochrome c-type biogenesis protein